MFSQLPLKIVSQLLLTMDANSANIMSGRKEGIIQLKKSGESVQIKHLRAHYEIEADMQFLPDRWWICQV